MLRFIVNKVTSVRFFFSFFHCIHFVLQWIISELACYTYSMVVVPLYDTLGPDAIRFIINTGKILIGSKNGARVTTD